MIKRSLKNYFVCYKYILIPFGTLFLGLIIGLSIFIPLAGSALNSIVTETKNVIEGMDVEPQALLNEAWKCVKELDWSSPAQAILRLISPEWLDATLKSAVTALLGGDEALTASASRISATVGSASSCVHTGFAVLAVFVFLGFISGYFLLKFSVRKQMASRAFWKVFLEAFADFVIISALTALSVWLASLWKYSLIFTFIFAVLAEGGVAIAEAYIVHGLGKIKFTEVFTVKNICFLALANFIIFAIWAAISVVISLLLNIIAGVVIGFVLFELTSIVTSLNAEAFVKDYAENLK